MAKQGLVNIPVVGLLGDRIVQQAQVLQLGQRAKRIKILCTTMSSSESPLLMT